MPVTNNTTGAARGCRPAQEVVGEVVSNRMKKTIVVRWCAKSRHAFYGRVGLEGEKFYAHDEKNEGSRRRCGAPRRDSAIIEIKALASQADCRKTALVPEIAADVNVSAVK